ncbi:MAG: peptidoglycan-binding domain-containing protein [Verrucomicrobiota bacterium]
MINKGVLAFIIVIASALVNEAVAGISFSFSSRSYCGKGYSYRSCPHSKFYYNYSSNYRCYPKHYGYYYSYPPVTVRKYYVYPEAETIYSDHFYPGGNGYPSAQLKYQQGYSPQQNNNHTEPKEKKTELETDKDDAKQSVSKSFAMGIQKKLKDKGFYLGEINGRLDQKTQEAIRSFQQARGLKETGQIDEALLLNLGYLTASKTQDKYL